MPRQDPPPTPRISVVAPDGTVYRGRTLLEALLFARRQLTGHEDLPQPASFVVLPAVPVRAR